VVKVLARRPSMPSRATVNISSSPLRNEAAALGRPYPVVQQGISRYAARCRDRVVERIDPLGVHPRLLSVSIALGKDTHREPVRPAMAARSARSFRGHLRWAEVWAQRRVRLMFWSVADLLTFPRVLLLHAWCLVLATLMPGQDFYLPRLLRGRVEARVSSSRVKGGRRSSRSDGKRS
jgi:hypothetical protein